MLQKFITRVKNYIIREVCRKVCNYRIIQQ